jgi:pimeloyl-ACP methyl ester carboxylesterase
MKHKINGLNVIESGQEDKQAMVFIHAFPLSHKMWDRQAEYFKNRYRVITYDTRGFGESYEDNGYYTIESHADDLFSIIDELKIIKPIVFGLSMGGYILLRAAERGQDVFKAIVLCDTRAEADMNESKLNRAKQIKQIRSGGRKDFLEAFSNLLLSEAIKTDPARISVVKEVRAIMDEQKDTAIEGALLTLSARADKTEFLENMNIPVLIIVGEKDKLTPPVLSKAMYQRIRNSKLSIIPNAGHLSNIENPQAFNQSIEDFVKTLKI